MNVEHTQALHNGTRLSQYEIASVLGSGGFGITYLARDTALDAPVAIKEYLPTELAVRQSDSKITAVSRAAEPDFHWGLERFLEEARVLAKFRHSHIVHVFQVFEANNTAYIVMEYAKGEPLAALIQRSGSLSEAQTREILLPIMDGLKRVHDRGFLHRDIKPGNIILRDDGGPALIDFGAARQAIETKSRSITSIVTEGYAPLEQYDPNGNQGPWTDIYALGAVAYKCVTGKTPPAATSRVRNDPLVPLSQASPGRVSPEFDAAVRWALAVYEEERPQSIGVLARAIGGQAERSSVPSRSQSSSEATQLIPQMQRSASGLHSGPPQGIAAVLPQRSVLKPSARTMMIAGGAVLSAIFLIGGLRLFSSLPSAPAANAPAPGQVGTTGLPSSGRSQVPPATPVTIPATLSGPVSIIDTATLRVAGHRVELHGVTGFGGEYAETLAKTLAEFGDVKCRLVPKTESYNCTFATPNGGRADVSEIALVNGAAVASVDSTPRQKHDEAEAKAAGRGIWATDASHN